MPFFRYNVTFSQQVKIRCPAKSYQPTLEKCSRERFDEGAKKEPRIQEKDRAEKDEIP